MISYDFILTRRDCGVVQFNPSAKSGPPTRRIPTAFRRVNHTFLYLYPRDT